MMTPPRIAMILSGFPRWSETFALPELLALDRRGLLGPVFATKSGDDFDPQPGARAFLNRVETLPAGSEAIQAEWLARRLEVESISAIHAYFAHTPASIAQLAADALSIPFGFSAHARDVRKIPARALAHRSKHAACVVACNKDVAADLRHQGATVTLLPHGVDTDRFTPAARSNRSCLRLLAVGRMVPKKGFDVLIEACSKLSRKFSLRFVGQGPEEESLRELVHKFDLDRHIEFAGLMNHGHLPRQYANSDLVIVPSVIDPSGDRDGLPNVVLEALSSGRAVIGSRVAALDSAINSGMNGLLVDPGDANQLAGAIELLAGDSELLDALGIAARETATRFFDVERCANAFADRLDEAYATPR